MGINFLGLRVLNQVKLKKIDGLNFKKKKSEI